MTKKKSPVKVMTLRQQLRAQAADKLRELQRLVTTAVERAMDEADVELNSADVMRMCVNSQTKTLHEQIITDLANQAEADLLKMWNNQQALPLGDDDAKDAD